MELLYLQTQRNSMQEALDSALSLEGLVKFLGLFKGLIIKPLRQTIDLCHVSTDSSFKTGNKPVDAR
jgi:hypothetical protein